MKWGTDWSDQDLQEVYLSLYPALTVFIRRPAPSMGLRQFEKYGAVKGLALTVWRILRCNPFAKGGYDPVP